MYSFTGSGKTTTLQAALASGPISAQGSGRMKTNRVLDGKEFSSVWHVLAGRVGAD